MCKVEDLAPAKGRRERAAGTGTEHGAATFMNQKQGSLLQYWITYVPFLFCCGQEEI